MGQNRVTVLLRLEKHYEDRTPCEVTCGEVQLVVYIAGINQEIVIARRVNTASQELSGWVAFCWGCIDEVQVAPDADLIAAAVCVSNEKLPPKLPFKAQSVSQFAGRVCRFFPVLIVSGKSTGDGMDGIAGTIVRSI